MKFLLILFFPTLILFGCGGGGGGGNPDPGNDGSQQDGGGNDSGDDGSGSGDDGSGGTDPDPISFDDALDFQSTSAFIVNLEKMSEISDAEQRTNVLNSYWQTLSEQNQIPFVTEDGAVFLYRDSRANQVMIQGDWNWFNPPSANATDPLTATEIAGTNLWYAERSFPSDARMDYQIVVNGNEWKLDPSNDRQQRSGFGYNSYFSMPDYERPQYRDVRDSDIKGTLLDNFLIESDELGYGVHYRVYLPYNYQSQGEMPTLYFVDGHEYADNEMGAAVTILDNMIADQVIPPAIAVFIDPRDTNTGENQRTQQFFFNPDTTAAFIVNELVPQITQAYPAADDASMRAIWGTSFGGMFSSYTCFHHSDTFGMCGVHSPATPHDETINVINNSAMPLPLKIALSTGSVGDFLMPGRDFRDLLESQGYTVQYTELSQGHSWGNWSDSLPTMVQYLLND